VRAIVGIPRYSLGVWDPERLLEITIESLAAWDRCASDEQAVYGLDSLDELGLHPVLAQGFEAAGYGVYRERVYPGEVERRHKGNARARCDIVLTRDPSAPLLDPVQELLTLDAASGTLFEPIAESMGAGEHVTEVGDAFWLEIKAVGQFGIGMGVPGPNGSYASLLVTGPAGDVLKIASEPMINAGAALVILFAQDERTARHDLTRMCHTLIDHDLPIGDPRIGVAPISERVGHSVVAAGLVPVRL
jgi:hypothetical protein